MNRKILRSLVPVLLLFFASCGKDDTNTAITGGYLTVRVDDREKSFSDVQGRWVDGGNYLEITATNDGNEWLMITVLSESTRVPAGEYALDDGSPFTILSTYALIGNNSQTNYSATRGTLAEEDAFQLTIDKIDNGAVEGEFSGMLVIVEGEQTLGTLSLENGRFNTQIKPN